VLFTDGPEKKVHVLNLETLKKQFEIADLDGEQIRCAISVSDAASNGSEKHVFAGCTNGLLLRLDPVNYFITMRIKLKKHIFCLL
jgi:hypothetical protein